MVLDAGGVIFEILSGYAGAVPTRMQLDAWITTYGLRVTTVTDVGEMVPRTIPTYGRRETLFIVDLRTMRIVNKYLGSTDGSGTSSIGMAVGRMLQLLRM